MLFFSQRSSKSDSDLTSAVNTTLANKTEDRLGETIYRASIKNNVTTMFRNTLMPFSGFTYNRLVYN